MNSRQNILWLYQIVGSLKFGRSLHSILLNFFLLLSQFLIASHSHSVNINRIFPIFALSVWYFIISCLNIALDLAINCSNAFASSRSYFFVCKESLSIGLNCVHEAFCLEVRIKFHRWPNFSAFISWAHRPGFPFGYVRTGVFPDLVCFCFCQSVIIRPNSSETHNSRAFHKLRNSSLFKAFTVIVCLLNWFNSHLFTSIFYSKQELTSFMKFATLLL